MGLIKIDVYYLLMKKKKIDEFVKQVENTNKRYQRIQKLSITLEEMIQIFLKVNSKILILLWKIHIWNQKIFL